MTLGSLALERDQRPLAGAALRRRPLALLAFVAASPHGVSRDKVLAYLWPESDTKHARNCLRQTLFALRRSLGQELFLPGPSALRLDPELLTADCWDFEHALERRACLEGVEVYRGPFLDGFYLEGHPEFERWVEAERAWLAGRYQAALETLVAQSERAGDTAGTLEWWWRLAKHNPLSSRIAIGLMRTLVATGDHPEALRRAEIHERLLREELDTRPDTGERVFVAQLRQRAACGR